MKNDIIKSIWFDFGNVLLPLDVDATYAGFKNLGAKKTLHKNHPLFHAWERGELSSEEFIKAISGELKYKAHAASIWQAWNAMILPLPNQVIPFLRRLSKRYKLILVSNINPEHEEYIKQHLGRFTYNQLMKSFTSVYYSHHIGKRKPEHSFFNHVLDEQQLSPEAVFFIDDTEENIVAAKALGIRGWHFNPQKDVIYDLDKVLLKHH